MKNIFVSLFSGYKNPVPEKSISLYEYFTDHTHKDIVNHIRTLTDKKEIGSWKSKLPAITVSGLFQTRHSLALIKHSGYICIDIDGGDNPSIEDFAMLRDELKKIINVAYASLSVSGKGVFCLIPLKDVDKHKEHFEALRLNFKTLGIVIDKSCSDVSRLRGYTYDPDAYYNENAIVYSQVIEYKPNVPKSIPSKLMINNKYKQGNSTHSKVMQIISKINETGTDITLNYEQWFQIACALANEFGEEGRNMFHLVSQNNPEYRFEESDNKFNQCLQNSYGYNIGTFFYWASN